MAKNKNIYKTPINDYTSTAAEGSVIRNPIKQPEAGKFEAPQNIISNPTAAKALYYIYRADHLKRIALYAQIEGLIAGNPPYDPVDLAQNGLSHIANFNPLDARALYERGALAYWNLLNQAQTVSHFTIRGEDPQLVSWAQTMSFHWDRVVRKWPSFATQVNTMTGQLVKFGISPIVWSDERDWTWRTIELSKFFVSDQALSDIEQLTSVFVETTYTAQYLWEIYSEYQNKKDETNWNLDELGKFLVFKANSFAKLNNQQIVDMMDLQRRLQNGDIGYDVLFNDDIRIVSQLQQEYDGKITHFMFDPTYAECENFLYEASNQYEDLGEALSIFTMSPGEFTIHSNRGLGHKIFSGCQAMMQLDCSIIDMARMSSTPLIKNPATGVQDFSTIRFISGVPTDIGMADFVQNQLGANIEQLIGASQYMLNKINYNSANSGDDPGSPDRNVGSIAPSQARMKAFKEFAVLKNNIAHFYSQFDNVIANMTVKMLHSKQGYPNYKYVKEWKDLCMADGVPEVIFETKGAKTNEMPRHLEVRATRVAGDGSQLALIMALEAFAPSVAALGAEGQRNYLKQLTTALFGRDYIPAFLGNEEPDESAGGASLAAVENAIMRSGESPVFSPDNEQRSHVAIHLALGTQVIEEIQQQNLDIVLADKIFNVLIPHGAEHMQAIANNPYDAGFLGTVKKPWEQISEYARLNRKNAGQKLKAELQKKQKAAEQQQEVMSDIQRKDAVAQADIQRKGLESTEKMARAQEQSDTRASLSKEKIQKDAENKRLEIQLDADAKAGKTAEQMNEVEIRNQLKIMAGNTPSPNDVETGI